MPKRSLYARRWAAFTLVTLATWASSRDVAAQSSTDERPCAVCIVLIATPPQARQVPGRLNGIEVVVRRGPLTVATETTPDADEAELVAAMTAIRDRGGSAGLFLRGLETPLPTAAVVLASRVVLDPGEPRPPDVVFRLQTRLTELRAMKADLRLGVVASRQIMADIQSEQLGPYIDFLARPDGPPPPYPATGRGGAGAAAIVDVDGATRQISATAVNRWLVDLPDDRAAAETLVSDIAGAAAFLGDDLISGGTAEVRCGDVRASTYLDPTSLDTVAILRGCGARQVTITPQVAGTRMLSLSTLDVIARIPAAEGGIAQDVQVVGARALTVREVIARHQAAAARQRRAIRTLISSGAMTLTFEAPGFPAPVAISSEAVIYAAADRTEIEQRDIRVNGIALQQGSAARLPLIEPERVAAAPLAIALTESYRYALEGQDHIDGRRSYVVTFRPVGDGRSLFDGRAWIDAATFALVRISAVQTGLRGPIVSSQRIDDFRPDDTAGWLLTRSEMRQIYEGPGHRTPIHRVLTIARHEINPGDFTARRTAAYARPSLVLRDTPEGFRYVRPVAPGEGSPDIEPPLAGRAHTLRALAFGVIVDPNISRPLPFAGVSYVDFDLFGTGGQVNVFFGGTYGQLAMSVPSLGGSRWQIAGRAFGIASSYNDRAFDGGRERYEANISQRPAHASVWLLRPLTSRFTARIGYDFDYTRFRAADTTSPDFVVPASQRAHALRLALEGQWSGWAASVWWLGARRAGWRSWGEPHLLTVEEPYDERQRDYQRIGTLISRSFVASPRLVGRLEGAWMAGRDLDRFSRYTFGSFDNRLRGYPSALIRYDRGGVVRAAVAWAAGRRLRIDGFADSAYVRDPGFGPGARNYTGIGAAAEIPAPFGTLAAIEWGYGFRGIDADGRRGTQVVRVTGYKMF
jgi:hypothetical protein